MVVFHHQNEGQNQNLLIANKCLEYVVKFKYLKNNKSKLHSQRY